MINEILSEIKKINHEDLAFIDLEVKDLVEYRQLEGNLFNKKFTCDVKIIWSYAKLESEMLVSDLIVLLEEKDISKFCNEDFKNASIVKTLEGNFRLSNVEWEIPLNEKEKKELESCDLEKESDILGSRLTFESGSVISITISHENFSRIISNK